MLFEEMVNVKLEKVHNRWQGAVNHIKEYILTFLRSVAMEIGRQYRSNLRAGHRVLNHFKLWTSAAGSGGSPFDSPADCA